jgi:hypothetical protein
VVCVPRSRWGVEGVASSGLTGVSSSLGYSVLPSIRTIEVAGMATRRVWLGRVIVVSLGPWGSAVSGSSPIESAGCTKFSTGETHSDYPRRNRG